MDEITLIEKIADKDVNINEFVNQVIRDENIREEIIKQLLTNEKIMVYYHCFYIISKASQDKPELFYNHWNDFVSLLDNKNSYHRDIGLTLIANLTKVDVRNYFIDLFPRYIKHFNDDKFMTAQSFVINLKKIIKNKVEFTEKVIDLLIGVDTICSYTEKQRELLKSDIIDVMEEAYPILIDKNKIMEFIKAQSASSSPKTRKRVKEFLKKLSL